MSLPTSTGQTETPQLLSAEELVNEMIRLEEESLKRTVGTRFDDYRFPHMVGYLRATLVLMLQKFPAALEDQRAFNGFIKGGEVAR